MRKTAAALAVSLLMSAAAPSLAGPAVLVVHIELEVQGSSAEQMERDVTESFKQTLMKVQGVTKVWSMSTENSSQVEVYFLDRPAEAQVTLVKATLKKIPRAVGASPLTPIVTLRETLGQ